MSNKSQEFVEQRAQLYGDVHRQFPRARAGEIVINMEHFKPMKGEKILEIGAGSGLYSEVLANHLTTSGTLFATDPSKDQLINIEAMNLSNVQIVEAGADTLLKFPILQNQLASFDGIWSLGAFHHCKDKMISFSNFAKLLKPKGRLFICDVFAGSQLARYFDSEVARYSITGHEVSFLSHEFAESLCYLYGFSKPVFHDIDYPWFFDSLEDMALFMHMIHGMQGITPEEGLEKVKEFMEVEKKDGQYILHVPLTILESYNNAY